MKFTRFKIIRLTLSGFRCFAGKTVFEFDDISCVTGGNGAGKSSLAQAVSYVLTGLTFFGEQAIGQLMNPDKNQVEVTLDFTDQNDRPHSLTRCRQGDKTEVVFDGNKVRQADIEQMFCEKDLLLSLFNPLYFIERLGDKGRALLQNILPVVPEEKVLDMLTENERGALLSPEQAQKIDTEILQYQKAIADLTAMGYEPKYAREITCAEAGVVLMRDKYSSIKERGKSLKPGDPCPLCGEALTEGNLSRLRASWASKLEEIKKTGLDFTEQQKELADLEEKARAVFEQFKADDLEKFRRETEQLQAKKDAAKNAKNTFTAKCLELSLEAFPMPNLSFLFFEIVRSTGEVRDAFIPAWQGRDYRCLSLSEKLRAGLEITALLRRVTGLDYPVFVDNAEIITDIDPSLLPGQTILSRVTKGAELTVRTKSSAPALKKAG